MPSIGNKSHKATSPVMGTFCRATAPGEKPLVVVGQRFDPTDFVCMVESMKVYTEQMAVMALTELFGRSCLRDARQGIK